MLNSFAFGIDNIKVAIVNAVWAQLIKLIIPAFFVGRYAVFLIEVVKILTKLDSIHILKSL